MGGLKIEGSLYQCTEYHVVYTGIGYITVDMTIDIIRLSVYTGMTGKAPFMPLQSNSVC